jgi:putative Mg2+ transporter-C (MgtC) family protein
MLTDFELVLRLLLAAFLGALIGYERERFNKPAGLRTHMLVCLGTALVIIYAENSFSAPDSWARVASGVITGIGFLGAGAIMQSRKRVKGLTTAATIWIVAIIGMAVGGGQFLGAAIATLLVLGILRIGEEHVIRIGLPSVTWLSLRSLPPPDKTAYKKNGKKK